MSEERFGNTKISTIRRDFNKLARAIQSHDPEATEILWDEKVVRWVDFAIGGAAQNACSQTDDRWVKALSEVIPDDCKDWRDATDEERPEIATSIIRNLRAREASLEVLLKEADMRTVHTLERVAKLALHGKLDIKAITCAHQIRAIAAEDHAAAFEAHNEAMREKGRRNAFSDALDYYSQRSGQLNGVPFSDVVTVLKALAQPKGE